MTALAGFWSFAVRPDAAQRCAAMLSAQRHLGGDRSESVSFGPMAMGRDLFALLPQDDSDRQPLIGGNGRFALVADVRLDNREELATVLRFDSATARTMADSDIL